MEGVSLCCNICNTTDFISITKKEKRKKRKKEKKGNKKMEEKGRKERTLCAIDWPVFLGCFLRSFDKVYLCLHQMGYA